MLCGSWAAFVQGLLGSIAGMSELQEYLDRQLLALDARLAALAAAIPAAQAAASAGIGAAAVGGGRLHCTVRPLKLRSQALRCRAGSGAVGDGSPEDELALEVGVRNSSILPLAGGWSVLIAYTPSSSGRGSSNSSSIAFADSLGGLQPRAEWRREFALPLARGVSGHLRVLLCLHADAAADSSSDSAALSGLGTEAGKSSVTSILQLHNVHFDALHLAQPSTGSGSSDWAPWTQPHLQPPRGNAQAGSSSSSSGGQRLQAKLRVQVHPAYSGRAPDAGMLMRQLLHGGLGTHLPLQQGQAREDQCPAFRLLPALGLLPTGAASSRQHAGGDWSCADSQPGIRVSAQVLPEAALADTQQRLLQVTAAASTPAAVLACHRALCLCVQHMQQAAAAAQAGGALQCWPRLTSGQGTLLPRTAGLGAVAAVASANISEAELEQALVQLRRLREAALLLRNAAAQQAGAEPAAQVQRRRQQEQKELQQLTFAARTAIASVPLLAM